MINENSEGLRFRFVNFVNKKTLKLVKIKESPEIEREDWEEFFDDISKQIKENMKDNIYDNIILNFTTNTIRFIISTTNFFNVNVPKIF